MSTAPAIQKIAPEVNGLELRDVAMPTLGADEVLIRVKGAAICGSDLHLYNWDESIRAKLNKASDDFAQGLTIGHEFCGTVEAIGEAVNAEGTPQYGEIAVGDFVSAESHAVCNKCYQCELGEKHVCVDDQIIGFDRHGAFSKYIALPASCVWKNDPDLPFELASIQEPLGNAMHAAAAFPLKGQSVAILGCGPIGLFACAIAKAHGAREVIAVDVNEYRLSIAARLGARTITQGLYNDPAERKAEDERVVSLLREFGGNDGPDVVLEMSGAPAALNNGISAVRRGGKVVLFGLPKNDEVQINRYSSDVVFKGLTLHAVIGRRIYETWEQVRDLLAVEENRQMIRSVITDVLPFDQFNEGFRKMLAGEAGKVVLDFSEA